GFGSITWPFESVTNPGSGMDTWDAPVVAAFAGLTRQRFWMDRARVRLQRDLESNPLQSAGQPLCRSLRVAAVVNVAALLLIPAPVANDVVRQDENPMGYGHGGLLHAGTRRNPEKQRGEGAVVHVRHCPGILHQHAAEITVSLAGSSAKTLAGTFRVARTQTRPTREVLRIGESAHVCANLRNQGVRGDQIDSGQ